MTTPPPASAPPDGKWPGWSSGGWSGGWSAAKEGWDEVANAWTYALGPTGLRLSGDGNRARRPSLPSPPMWQHALLGAEIYTRLVEATRGSDRELALWQGEPDCWRDYPGQYGEQVRLKRTRS